MKICNTCNTKKELSEFRNKEKRCKKCYYERNLNLERTKKGIVKRLYIDQKSRKDKKLYYSEQELFIWFWDQPNAEILYSNWVDSGYLKSQKPSVDRLDDYKGYSFDNIQLITWKENNKKPTPKKRKKVLKYDLEMNFITEYKSLTEAANSINGHKSDICHVCKGKNKTSKGFIWRYKS